MRPQLRLGNRRRIEAEAQCPVLPVRRGDDLPRAGRLSTDSPPPADSPCASASAAVPNGTRWLGFMRATLGHWGR